MPTRDALRKAQHAGAAASGGELPAHLANLAQLAEMIHDCYTLADDTESAYRSREYSITTEFQATALEMLPQVQAIAGALFDVWQRLEAAAAPYLAAVPAPGHEESDDEPAPVSGNCADGFHKDCSGHTDDGQEECVCSCHPARHYDGPADDATRLTSDGRWWDGEKWVDAYKPGEMRVYHSEDGDSFPYGAEWWDAEARKWLPMRSGYPSGGLLRWMSQGEAEQYIRDFIPF